MNYNDNLLWGQHKATRRTAPVVLCTTWLWNHSIRRMQWLRVSQWLGRHDVFTMTTPTAKVSMMDDGLLSLWAGVDSSMYDYSIKFDYAKRLNIPPLQVGLAPLPIFDILMPCLPVAESVLLVYAGLQGLTPSFQGTYRTIAYSNFFIVQFCL